MEGWALEWVPVKAHAFSRVYCSGLLLPALSPDPAFLEFPSGLFS